MNRHGVVLGNHFRGATKMVVIGSKRPVADTSHLLVGYVEKSLEPYWWVLGVGNGA